MTYLGRRIHDRHQKPQPYPNKLDVHKIATFLILVYVLF